MATDVPGDGRRTGFRTCTERKAEPVRKTRAAKGETTVPVPVKRHRGEPGHTQISTADRTHARTHTGHTSAQPHTVKRHRGEPGHYCVLYRFKNTGHRAGSRDAHTGRARLHERRCTCTVWSCLNSHDQTDPQTDSQAHNRSDPQTHGEDQ